MAIEKITEAQRKAVRIVGLNDVPGLSTEQMQQRFDGLGNLAIDKLNELIDFINSGLEASSIVTNVENEDGVLLDINAVLEQILADITEHGTTLNNHTTDINNLKTAVSNIDSSLTAILETETF